MFYINKLNDLKLKESKARHLDKLFAVTKLLSFLTIVICFYYFLTTDTIAFPIVCVAALVAYLLLSLADSKHFKKLRHIERAIAVIEIEMAYCTRDYSRLHTGNEYIDPHHEYCYDLDIFGDHSLFQAINRCITQEGQDLLAHNLKYRLTDPIQIKDRQVAIADLAKQSDWRIDYCATKDGTVMNASGLSNLNSDGLVQLSNQTTVYFAYAYSFIACALIALSIFDYLPQLWIGVAMVSQLIITTFKASTLGKITSKTEGMYKNFRQYHHLILQIQKLEDHSPYLTAIKAQLFRQSTNAETGFAELQNLMGAFDRRNNIYATLFCNGLFMLDLHTVRTYQLWMQRYAQLLPNWIQLLAEVDMLCSVANFSFNHPDFVFPTIQSSQLIACTGLGHPLISPQKLVRNDFSIMNKQHFAIITGANMAGKSTFLRSLGVNLVLANMGAPVSATSFLFTPMQVFSSMRTSDILAEGTSYFKAELLRLKQMLNCIERETITFIILDEILKGTNSVDKLKGSQLFLQKLIGLSCSGLIATHDLALGEMELLYPQHISNNCFEITTTSEGIVYDYKLKQGISKNMNATQLIKEMLLN